MLPLFETRVSHSIKINIITDENHLFEKFGY